MATNPIAFEDDFNAVVARIRHTIASRRENRLDVREESSRRSPRKSATRL
ncbi:MAG TPA: hypothetical protein VGO92_12915 [Acidimicrobiales bacterium]|nr:hypothetical protein [Acidimicrobiales bacterium]